MSFSLRSLRSLLAGVLVFLTVGLVLGQVAAAQTDPTKTVDLIHVEGLVDPTMAEYLEDRLERAAEEGIHAAIIQLDTPGGLDVPMREIITQMLELETPVVVWIAPRGARAASAGTFITYAADLAFMAEATELGAATPIDLGG